MQDRNYTFEELSAHIDKHFVPVANAKALSKADANNRLCSIYHVARPVLVILTKIPLIPPKIKNVIKAFIEIVDIICK